MRTAEFPASHELSDASRLVPSPLVSVIVLVYNHEEYLAQTLDSILSQDVDFPFEVLVGEDCSTDASRQIALHYQRSHPHAVRVITADRNVGVFHNARRLLEATRGDFIASVDGDDYWLPGKLKRQVRFLADHAGCNAVYANAIVIDRSSRVVGVFNNAGTGCFDLAALVRRGNFLNSSSVMYRAQCKDALTGTDLLDYKVGLALAGRGSIGHLSEPLVVYRLASSGSMLANDNAKVRELYWEAILGVRDAVGSLDLAAGLADFLSRVTFRSVRMRNASLLREWTPKVLAQSPVPRWRFCMLFAWTVLRSLLREIAGSVTGALRGGGHVVLYRQ